MPIDYALRAAKARQAALRNDPTRDHPNIEQEVAERRRLNAEMNRMAREQLKAEVAHRRKVRTRQTDLRAVAEQIQTVVGNCVPDGDPIDALAPWVRRHLHLEEYASVGEWLDKAARKHLGVKDYTEYLIIMWDAWNESCPAEYKIEPNPWRPL